MNGKSPRIPLLRRPLNRALTHVAGFAALAGLVSLLPHLTGSVYHHHLFVLSLIYLILATSYNLFVGYTGYLSLAHATFFGIGGYVSAILTTRYGASTGIGMLAGMLLSAATSGVLGWVLLQRLRGFPFALTTLGFAVTAWIVALNWLEVTGGPVGIAGVPRPIFGIGGHPITLRHPIDFYYPGVGLAAISIGLVGWVRSSRIGRALVAIRENELLAAAVGVNTFKYKLFAFITASTIAAAAGSFYAHYFTTVSPEILWIYTITLLLTILIVGGPGSLIGVMIATVVLVFVPESLRIFRERKELLYGVVLLSTIRFFPQGIGGLISQIVYRRGLLRWRSSLLGASRRDSEALKRSTE